MEFEFKKNNSLQKRIEQYEKIEKEYPDKVPIIIEKAKNSVKLSTDKKAGRKRLTIEDKQRILNDYKNHDVDYMLKKYGYKNKKCLQQKIYLIRNELGLGVRNK